MDVAHKHSHLAATLMNSSFFKGWDAGEIARLIPHVRKQQFQAGDYLYRADAPAERLYIVFEGQAEAILCSGGNTIAVNELAGEEAALGFAGYLADVVVREPLQAYVLPKAAFDDRGQQDKNNGDCYRALVQRYSGSSTSADDDSLPADRIAKDLKVSEVIGWLLALAMPAAVLIWGEQLLNLDWGQRHFLAAFVSTVVAWVFHLVPAFVGGLFTVLVSIVLGIVPANVVLSGYSTSSFFMALSIFGLGSVVARSGVTYRIGLMILKYCPNSPFFYNLALLLAGIALTPVLPSTNGRVGLLAPLIEDIRISLGYDKGSKGATRLALSTFVGLSIFSPVFLTSKSLNFVVFGLLPAQVQEHYQWLEWFLAASLPLLLMLVLYLVFSAVFFRVKNQSDLPREQLNTQLVMLGPVSTREWIAILGVLIFILAAMTSSVHKISPPWVSLAIFYALLSLGVMHTDHLREDIDWGFLLLLGAMLGLVSTLRYTGLDQVLVAQLSFLGTYLENDIHVFAFMLFLIVAFLRLFLPITAAGVLVATIFIPMAESYGVNAWVIAFVILMIVECWVFPYQASYALMFDSIVGNRGVYDKTAFLRFNALTVLFRVVAIYAALSMFQYTGVL